MILFVGLSFLAWVSGTAFGFGIWALMCLDDLEAAFWMHRALDVLP